MVRELDGLDLGRVETAVSSAAQAVFAEKTVGDLDVGSGFCVRGALGLDAK